MSNYVQATNFATKDALVSGDPLKIVKGTEINTEFANIAVAVATKADLVSPTFTGTPLAPTAAASTNSTQIATTAYADAAIVAAKSALYPIGSIYTSTVATNPGTLLGFGTWIAFGAGRVLIGDGGGYAAGATGGSADAIVVSHTHTATVTDPGHLHNLNVQGEVVGGSVVMRSDGAFSNTTPTLTATTGITVANSTTGSSGTNANLQPYIVVYLWNRTA